MKFIGRDCKQPIDYMARIALHLEAVKAGKVPEKLVDSVLEKD